MMPFKNMGYKIILPGFITQLFHTNFVSLNSSNLSFLAVERESVVVSAYFLELL